MLAFENDNQFFQRGTNRLQLGWTRARKRQWGLVAIGLHFCAHQLASAVDRKPVRVEQLFNAQHMLHVSSAVHPLSGGALGWFQLREFRLPEAQH